MLAVLGAGAPALARTPPVVVSVYGTRHGGDTVYHYAIRNAGADEILRLTLGCAPGDASIPELQAMPVGAAPIRADTLGTWYELPATAVTRPAGWRARLVRPHDAGGHCIEWQAPGPGEGIPPGTTKSGFAVAVAGTDESYLWSRFAASTAAGTVEGALTRADRRPPTISLSGRIEPSGGTMATVRLEAVATDDRDPKPQVILESLERAADGKPGYIVRYAAVDASGNRASAELRLDLPRAAPAGAPARLLPLASLP
ncbi:MAG TPA: hypothetical protein VIL43_12470 [Burkholderiales bacterium]